VKFGAERVFLFVQNRELYVGLACVELEAFPALSFQGFRGVVPPACRLRCAPSYHSSMYRPPRDPFDSSPPSRSSETFFQPVRVLTWRVMLTRAIASISANWTL